MSFNIESAVPVGTYNVTYNSTNKATTFYAGIRNKTKDIYVGLLDSTHMPTVYIDVNWITATLGALDSTNTAKLISFTTTSNTTTSSRTGHIYLEYKSTKTTTYITVVLLGKPVVPTVYTIDIYNPSARDLQPKSGSVIVVNFVNNYDIGNEYFITVTIPENIIIRGREYASIEIDKASTYYIDDEVLLEQPAFYYPYDPNNDEYYCYLLQDSKNSAYSSTKDVLYERCVLCYEINSTESTPYTLLVNPTGDMIIPYIFRDIEGLISENVNDDPEITSMDGYYPFITGSTTYQLLPTSVHVASDIKVTYCGNGYIFDFAYVYVRYNKNNNRNIFANTINSGGTFYVMNILWVENDAYAVNLNAPIYDVLFLPYKDTNSLFTYNNITTSELFIMMNALTDTEFNNFENVIYDIIGSVHVSTINNYYFRYNTDILFDDIGGKINEYGNTNTIETLKVVVWMNGNKVKYIRQSQSTGGGILWGWEGSADFNNRTITGDGLSAYYIGERGNLSTMYSQFKNGDVYTKICTYTLSFADATHDYGVDWITVN